MKIKIDKSHVYGELTMPSIIKIAEHMHKHKKKSFLDIGSGYGLVTRGINEYFREIGLSKKVTGIEKDLERVNMCNAINSTKETYKKKYKIVHGDVFHHTDLIAEADYIFSNSLLFPETFPEKTIMFMKPGTIFVHNTLHSKLENRTSMFLSSTWNDKNYFKVYVKE